MLLPAPGVLSSPECTRSGINWQNGQRNGGPWLEWISPSYFCWLVPLPWITMTFLNVRSLSWSGPAVSSSLPQQAPPGSGPSASSAPQLAVSLGQSSTSLFPKSCLESGSHQAPMFTPGLRALPLWATSLNHCCLYPQSEGQLLREAEHTIYTPLDFVGG